MTFYFSGVKNFAAIILLGAFLAPTPGLADEGFVVKPVESPEQVRLLPAQTWPRGEEQAELMFKLAYVRGLLDAWQLSSLAPRGARQALRDLQGASLLTLVRALDEYYADKSRQLPPSSAILRVISVNYKEGAKPHEQKP